MSRKMWMRIRLLLQEAISHQQEANNLKSIHLFTTQKKLKRKYLTGNNIFFNIFFWSARGPYLRTFLTVPEVFLFTDHGSNSNAIFSLLCPNNSGNPFKSAEYAIFLPASHPSARGGAILFNGIIFPHFLKKDL